VSIVCGCSTAAWAQWIAYPTPGIPRTLDGRPDLNAPAPRTMDGRPDLSGMWGWQPGRFFGSIVQDLKPEEIKSWARALAAERAEQMGRDDPSNFLCLPQGPRMNLHTPIPAKIVQTPGLIVILSEDLTYRQIFLDGRNLPHNPDPSFMGYSIGRWEGDALVVETIGFKDRTWLDFAGMPHSESLRITERIRRTRFGRLEIEQTVSDPEVFTRPFTVNLAAHFIADTELLEYICAENERSRRHMVGTASEEIERHLANAVTVAPSVLARYVGTYDFRFPENPTTPNLGEVRLDGDRLLMGNAPLIPLSEKTFAGPFGTLEFVIGERGIATHFLIRVAEGELKVDRVE
jgi:hypothetical protein